MHLQRTIVRRLHRHDGLPRSTARSPQALVAIVSCQEPLPGASDCVSFVRAIALREKSNLLNGFNLIWVVQSSSQIYSASPSPQISGFFRAVSSRQEGRFAIVTNARWDVVDAT